MKRHYILLFIGIMLLYGCRTGPLDYRNKWVGEWQIEQVIYDYGVQTLYEYSVTTEIEKEGRQSIIIDGYTFEVKRDGSLHQPANDARSSGGTRAGHVSKNTLSLDFNTSAGVDPGAQILMLGHRQ